MGAPADRAKAWLSEAIPALKLETPILAPEARDLATDVATARAWLVGVGTHLLRACDEHNDTIDYLIGKANTCAALAALPGDMPLRARLTPNLFNLKA
jgi:hypothetical protein